MKPETRFAIDGRYIQDHFPGIGRYTFNLVDALARVAPEESFVVLHNPALKNTRYDLAALARYPNIELRRSDIPTFSLAEQYRVQSVIRNSQFAILHSPYMVKPYLLRLPSIVTIFDLIPFRFPRDWNARARLIFRLAVSLAARTATRILAPSNATRDDLIACLRVPREKIAVTPLAADARFAPPSASEIARVRAKYGLPAQYILTVGINKPHKNHATLIAAWRRARVNAALVIAGAWDARYADEQESKRAGNPAQIFRLHNVDDADLPGLYAGASVFVFPSLCEGFGLPPLEAMACGAPVLASYVSSLPEVVGDAGLLFDPRDADALATLIARVVDDRARRDELRDKGLARAAEFSWERTARATLQTYRTAAR